MKKIFFAFLLFYFSSTGYAQTNCDKKNLAEVTQYNGIYVFFNCKPVQEYEFIATMRKMATGSTLSDGFQRYAAMAKKEYPDCDAIIFKDMTIGFNKDVFDVIQFKK